jgi:predicted nucleotidyltransferase
VIYARSRTSFSAIVSALGPLQIRCASLEQLIALKSAAGRPKDFEALAELRAIQDE